LVVGELYQSLRTNDHGPAALRQRLAIGERRRWLDRDERAEDRDFSAEGRHAERQASVSPLTSGHHANRFSHADRVADQLAGVPRHSRTGGNREAYKWKTLGHRRRANYQRHRNENGCYQRLGESEGPE